MLMMMMMMVIALMRLKNLVALMMTIFRLHRSIVMPLVARVRVDVDSLLMMLVLILTSVVICSGR